MMFVRARLRALPMLELPPELRSKAPGRDSDLSASTGCWSGLLRPR